MRRLAFVAALVIVLVPFHAQAAGTVTGCPVHDPDPIMAGSATPTQEDNHE